MAACEQAAASTAYASCSPPLGSESHHAVAYQPGQGVVSRRAVALIRRGLQQRPSVAGGGQRGNHEGTAGLARPDHRAPRRPTPASATAPVRPNVADSPGGRVTTPTTTPAAPGPPTEHARAPAAAPRSGTPRRRGPMCHRRVPPPRRGPEPPEIGSGSKCVGSSIGSPPLHFRVGDQGRGQVLAHQPRPLHSGAGAPPNVTNSSGATPGPAPGPCRR